MTNPTPPDKDLWLPERMAAVGILVRGERNIFEDYVRMLDDFFNEIRPKILKPLLRVIDPFGVFAQLNRFGKLVERFVGGGVSELLRTSYGQVLGEEFPFTNRPFVTRHLAEVENRMMRLPDQVFDYIRIAVDEGMSEGEGIPELSERIDQQLLRTDSERWRNRANVVARTESMGAYNWGTLDAYDLIAEVTGDVFEKIWLATMDHRTRDSHFIADGQRVPFAQPFTVGGFAGMVPGDPTLPPQEVIQCRCTFLVVKPGEVHGYYNDEVGDRGETLRGYRPDSATNAEIRRRAARGIIRSGDQGGA